MCGFVALEPVPQVDQRVDRVLNRLRVTHSNGGAYLATVRVGSDDVFDWFASRNRLLENDILPLLLRREEFKTLLPELKIPESLPAIENQETCSVAASGGFNLDNSFLLDGQLGLRLFAGGAYDPDTKISGCAAMELAADYCQAVFGRRYEEVSLFTSYEAWSPWFTGIAWDWTSVLFDRQDRTMWVLVVTDED